MKARDDLLRDLGLSASDGGDANWDEIQASAGGALDRRLVEDMRALSLIGAYYRKRRREDEDAAAPSSDLWGDLQIVEEIGRGSYGTVFRARDTRLGREIALKVIRASEGDEGIRSSILREGERMARVKHPNLVTIFGVQIREGQIGLAMESIRGTTLHDLVAARGRLGAREAVLLGCDLCGAIAALHAAGLIHRDIKAGNVMREEGGRVVLMDLGAGAELRSIAQAAEGRTSGTPLYMAPEVLAGGAASAQSDIYSLGVLLYYAVTGSYPVTGDSLAELRRRHALGERTRLRDQRPDLPGPFVAVIERAIAPEPADRFKSAGEMEQSLLSALGGRPSVGGETQTAMARPLRSLSWRSRIAAAAGASALALILLFVWPGFLAPVTYTVAASLHRARHGAVEELLPGARVAPGDRLFLQFEASRTLHVYVLAEDDRGEAFLLFPLPGHSASNPLPGGTAHRLPPDRDGRSYNWGVSSAGGTEHFLIVASPKALTEFEAALAMLPAPKQAPSATALPLDERSLRGLRGIGLLQEAAPGSGGSGTRLAFAMARRLSGTSERSRGVWIRQIDLINPAR